MNSKGYTVGSYLIKSEKKNQICQCVLCVKNVKTDPFAKTEKIKRNEQM